MDDGTGAAIVIAVAALVVVLFVTKKQEAQTAMQANNIRSAKANDPLTGGDAVGIIGTAVATYVGGPAAGKAALSAWGTRL